MRLADLIAGIDGLTGPAPRGAVEVVGVTDDSREVRPGFVFVARPGVKQDGGNFIADAVRAGAVAVVAAPESDAAGEIVFETTDPALAGARLVERFHGDPSSRLDVVGITGTNGKTTTSFLTHALLAAAGRKTALITTVLIDDGARREKAVMTTPGAGQVSATLARAVANGCDAAALETSSHALDQRRVAGVRYKAAIFTNLTGDHLDYHGTMESYADAKARLFESLPAAADGGVAVVNADDPWSLRMLRDCRARVFACTSGGGGGMLRDGGREWARCRVEQRGTTMAGMDLTLAGPWGEIAARLPLVGPHNAMNALQATAVAHALGATNAEIARGLAGAPAPPGRLERVTPRFAGANGQAAVFVDYAHTDDALERVLTALRPLVAPGGRLLCAFGAGGDKDRTKRPRMGRAVARLADVPVVTSDNPRTEEPMSIIGMILDGMDEGQRKRAIVDPDRERAIGAAIDLSREGDILVIAGKGHEDYQILPDGKGGTVRRDFDDRVIAREALEKQLGSARAAVAGGRA